MDEDGVALGELYARLATNQRSVFDRIQEYCRRWRTEGGPHPDLRAEGNREAMEEYERDPIGWTLRGSPRRKRSPWEGPELLNWNDTEIKVLRGQWAAVLEGVISEARTSPAVDRAATEPRSILNGAPAGDGTQPDGTLLHELKDALPRIVLGLRATAGLASPSILPSPWVGASGGTLFQLIATSEDPLASALRFGKQHLGPLALRVADVGMPTVKLVLFGEKKVAACAIGMLHYLCDAVCVMSISVASESRRGTGADQLASLWAANFHEEDFETLSRQAHLEIEWLQRVGRDQALKFGPQVAPRRDGERPTGTAKQLAGYDFTGTSEKAVTAVVRTVHAMRKANPELVPAKGMVKSKASRMGGAGDRAIEWAQKNGLMTPDFLVTDLGKQFLRDRT